MNIQIFGKTKCFETKKAQMYFKERNINFQFIDINRYGISKKEYNSVKQAVGGYDKLIDTNSKAYQKHHIAYLAPTSAIEEKLQEHPELFKTPIVRNKNQATVGYSPNIWKTWD